MNKRIPGLDFIRYVSLCIVISTHFFDVLNNLGVAVQRPDWLNRLAELAVGSFFVTSAFLITLLFLEEYEQKGRFSLRKFLLRRSFRLLPAYFVLVLLVYFVVYQFTYFYLPQHPAQYYQGVDDSIFNFLFLTPQINEFYHPSAPYLFHTSTLGVEFQFYVLAGCLFCWWRKQYLAAWILFFLFIAAFLLVHNNQPGYLKANGLGLLNTLGIYLEYAQLHLFALGVFAAYLFYRRENFLSGLPMRIGIVLLFAAALLLYVLSGENEWRSLTQGGVLFLLLVLLMVNRAFLSAFPYARTIQFFGNISYGAYLFHYIIMVLVVKTFVNGLNPESVFTRGILLFLVLAACTLGGIFSYYLIEKPFLRIKNKFATLVPARQTNSEP